MQCEALTPDKKKYHEKLGCIVRPVTGFEHIIYDCYAG